MSESGDGFKSLDEMKQKLDVFGNVISTGPRFEPQSKSQSIEGVDGRDYYESKTPNRETICYYACLPVALITIVLNCVVVVFVLINFKRLGFEEDVRTISLLNDPVTACSLDPGVPFTKDECLLYEVDVGHCVVNIPRERTGPFDCPHRFFFLKPTEIINADRECDAPFTGASYAIADDCLGSQVQVVCDCPGGPCDAGGTSFFCNGFVPEPRCLLRDNCAELSSIKAELLSENSLFQPVEILFYPLGLIVCIIVVSIIDTFEQFISFFPEKFAYLLNSGNVKVLMGFNFSEYFVLVLVPLGVYFSIISQSGASVDAFIIFYSIFNLVSITWRLRLDYQLLQQLDEDPFVLIHKRNNAFM